ncbi:YceD family protein [Frondihabitans sucicola]|uniref:YceD family protein n=1 Tax=Frondihabitans sucicola TaxID=1268041 RepID=UPI0033066B10
MAQSVEVDFAEVFAYSTDEAFDYQVQDDHVDLEPVVRDAVVLSLPFQPVCRPDCPGLDPETGERIEDLVDYHPREVIDLRWSALSQLVAETEPAATHEDSKPND